MPKKKEPYDVGYGKPPVSGQFTKGTSGNPNGRPKGSRNIISIVEKESRTLVQINTPKGPRFITKREAAATQLTNKAAQGDHRATRELFAILGMFDEANKSAPSPQTSREVEQQIVKDIAKRLKRMNDNGKSTKVEPEENE